MKFSFNALVCRLIIDPLLAGAQSGVISRLKPGQKVLDIACGTGSLSTAMAGKYHM